MKKLIQEIQNKQKKYYRKNCICMSFSFSSSISKPAMLLIIQKKYIKAKDILLNTPFK